VGIGTSILSTSNCAGGNGARVGAKTPSDDEVYGTLGLRHVVLFFYVALDEILTSSSISLPIFSTWADDPHPSVGIAHQRRLFHRIKRFQTCAKMDKLYLQAKRSHYT